MSQSRLKDGRLAECFDNRISQRREVYVDRKLDGWCARELLENGHPPDWTWREWGAFNDIPEGGSSSLLGMK